MKPPGLAYQTSLYTVQLVIDCDSTSPLSGNKSIGRSSRGQLFWRRPVAALAFALASGATSGDNEAVALAPAACGSLAAKPPAAGPLPGISAEHGRPEATTTTVVTGGAVRPNSGALPDEMGGDQQTAIVHQQSLEAERAASRKLHEACPIPALKQSGELLVVAVAVIPAPLLHTCPSQRRGAVYCTERPPADAQPSSA